jgi:sRNA-binding protein
MEDFSIETQEDTGRRFPKLPQESRGGFPQATQENSGQFPQATSINNGQILRVTCGQNGMSPKSTMIAIAKNGIFLTIAHDCLTLLQMKFFIYRIIN